jgi:hypothetical protein
MTTSQSQPKSSDGGEEVEMMGDATGNERASGEKEIGKEKEKVSVWRKVVKVLMWTPPGLRLRGPVSVFIVCSWVEGVRVGGEVLRFGFLVEGVDGGHIVLLLCHYAFRSVSCASNCYTIQC